MAEFSYFDDTPYALMSRYAESAAAFDSYFHYAIALSLLADAMLPGCRRH